MSKTITLQDYLRIKKDERELLASFDCISEVCESQTDNFEPCQRTIDNILNFSRALSIFDTKYGAVEMIVN